MGLGVAACRLPCVAACSCWCGCVLLAGMAVCGCALAACSCAWCGVIRVCVGLVSGPLPERGQMGLSRFGPRLCWERLSRFS